MVEKNMVEKKKYYKIKEIADRAGVTVRTLRYYDKIELLKPSYKNELNYRFYTDEDLAELQKIISLKFLGFSINEIEEIRLASNEEQVDMLKRKKRLLEQKINHLNFINNSLERVESNLNINTDVDWCSIATGIKESRIESHKKSCGKSIKDISQHKVLHGELIEVLRELIGTKNEENEKQIINQLKEHMNKMVNSDNGLDMLVGILEDVEDIPGRFRGLTSSDARMLIDIITKYIE